MSEVSGYMLEPLNRRKVTKKGKAQLSSIFPSPVTEKHQVMDMIQITLRHAKKPPDNQVM